MEITIETKVSDICSLILLHCNELIPQFRKYSINYNIFID
jgi:hypothetical protein